MVGSMFIDIIMSGAALMPLKPAKVPMSAWRLAGESTPAQERACANHVVIDGRKGGVQGGGLSSLPLLCAFVLRIAFASRRDG